MDPSQPLAGSLVLQNGRISQVVPGTKSIPEGSHKKEENFGGRIILPGLTDSHIHLRQYALNLKQLDVETPTKSECLDRVSTKARSLPPGEWILGHGWDHNRWAMGYGSLDELDQAAPSNPVYLTAKSLHVSWVNTLALEAAGVSKTTPDPSGGKISRDQQGNPTGLLFEEAVKLIEEILPTPDLKKTAGAIRDAQKVLWKLGLTGVHDFDRKICFQALQLLNSENELLLRVQKNIPLELLSPAIELGIRTGFGGEMIWIGGVKVFADGALGPQTAAMLTPYQDSGGQKGMLLLSEQELQETGIRAARHGLAMAIHAIGDRANRTVLNALAQVRLFEKQQGGAVLPHRIEHVQLISPEDKNRLAELGITASMQPIHAISDMEMADRYWGNRASLAYAPQTQLEAGARVIFGSDAPVENPNPFWGIHAAVSRRRPDGSPGPNGWYPAQRISRHEAINAYTTTPAEASSRDQLLGKLSPGYAADLIVLDQDPFTIPVDEIRHLSPSGTMVNGEWVYRSF